MFNKYDNKNLFLSRIYIYFFLSLSYKILVWLIKIGWNNVQNFKLVRNWNVIKLLQTFWQVVFVWQRRRLRLGRIGMNRDIGAGLSIVYEGVAMSKGKKMRSSFCCQLRDCRTRLPIRFMHLFRIVFWFFSFLSLFILFYFFLILRR